MKLALKRISTGIALMGTVVAAQADGLLHVQQTIFGMDCAPCAYGVQQRLTKLPGVTKVDVSLNDGTADIGFAADSTTTLPQIYGVLVDGGFTPKQAVVTVVGRLVRDGERWLVVTGTSRYALVLPHGGSFEPQAGSRVRIEGEILEPGRPGDAELKVQDAAPAGT